MTIKYCVWDVGQVIYPYTLSYLDTWAFSKTKSKEDYINKGGIKTFDYKPYMLGKENNEEFTKRLCFEYNIPFGEQTLLEVKKALYQGVGKFYKETIETMKILSSIGIQNCILSNALPMLADTAPKLVDEKYRFASFNLHLLKPNPEIYVQICQRLNCHFNEIIFIDDKEKNVLVADSLGIHGIVFNRQTIQDKCLKLIKENNYQQQKIFSLKKSHHHER